MLYLNLELQIYIRILKDFKRKCKYIRLKNTITERDENEQIRKFEN